MHRVDSMIAPTVAAVMLANGRPEMVTRAVKSFRAQTYENRAMLILNSGNRGDFEEHESDDIAVLYFPDGSGRSIGSLRNSANLWTDDTVGIEAEIICHWDSDDWSHPNRITEQVALLQTSGAECVGYDEMLFWQRNIIGWKAKYDEFGNVENFQSRLGEAWLYSEGGIHNVKGYAIGTSMCYWRKTWEQSPFPDYSAGCDDWRWATGDTKTGTRAVKIVSAPAFCETTPDRITWKEPMMIASIHGGNTCANFIPCAREWKRVPEWDAYCREAMKL